MILIKLTDTEYYMLLTILKQVSQMRGTASAFYARRLSEVLQRARENRGIREMISDV